MFAKLHLIHFVAIFISSSHASLFSPMQCKFYHAVQEDLGWCRPFPKFLCIKGIVFMTFWQSMAIAFLAHSTDLASDRYANDSDHELWGRQAQNFMICLEMLLFSIAHFYCFPTEEWEDGYRPAIEKKMSAGDNLALGDFMSDLRLILRGSDIALETKKRNSKTSKISSRKDTRITKKTDDDIDVLSTIVEDKKAEKHVNVDAEEGMEFVEEERVENVSLPINVARNSSDPKRQKRFIFRRRKGERL